MYDTEESHKLQYSKPYFVEFFGLYYLKPIAPRYGYSVSSTGSNGDGKRHFVFRSFINSNCSRRQANLSIFHWLLRVDLSSKVMNLRINWNRLYDIVALKISCEVSWFQISRVSRKFKRNAARRYKRPMNTEMLILSTFQKCRYLPLSLRRSGNLSMAGSMELLVYVTTFSNISFVKNKLNDWSGIWACLAVPLRDLVCVSKCPRLHVVELIVDLELFPSWSSYYFWRLHTWMYVFFGPEINVIILIKNFVKIFEFLLFG